MFELVHAPESRHRFAPPAVPSDGLLLRPVAAPSADEVWSFAPCTVEVAARDGWRVVRVLAWTWNPSGPILWRCAFDLGGGVSWYAYDARRIRPVDRGRGPR